VKNSTPWVVKEEDPVWVLGPFLSWESKKMKSDIRLLVLLLLPFLPVLQACGGAGAWEGTITDSAGVSIVMNTATPMWRAGDAWTVEEELRIGTVAGEAELQFGLITGLDVAPDGTVYVLDMQASEVRAFDAEGNPTVWKVDMGSMTVSRAAVQLGDVSGVRGAGITEYYRDCFLFSLQGIHYPVPVRIP